MKRLLTLTLLLLSGFSVSFSQISLKIQAPTQTEVGQRIRVSYVANTTSVEDIQVGDFPGFDVLYGPSTSSSSSFTMINGKTSQSSTLTFTYTLAATSSGVHRLPVATIKVDGKQYKSNSASIEVLASTSGGQRSQNNAGTSASGPDASGRSASSGSISDKDLYMTVSVSKKKVYEQEAVLLTYRLYTLLNIQQIGGEMPQLDGFHVQEVDSKAQMSLTNERINGRNYGTAIWRQYVLFPQKAGKLTVPSITFESQIEIPNTSMDPFDVFFGGGSLNQVVKKKIVAPSIDIDVQALPLPKPEHFTGAVGQFAVSANLLSNDISANDAATLNLTVRGQGNIKLMRAPKVDFPKDFEVYDPKEEDNSVNTSQGSKGSKVYSYIVVPRHAGKYTVPPVEFCYFDPDKGTYKTLKTSSFEIDVAKAKNASSGVYHEQEDLKILDSDIRFIKLRDLTIIDSSDELWGSTSYWLCYIALIGGFLALVIVFKSTIKDNFNPSRDKKAGKEASKRLKHAFKLLKNHEREAFYDEIMRVILGYTGDKLHLSNAELTKENVVQILTQKGVDNTLIQQFIDILSKCEFARYAPGDIDETMDKVLAEAIETINKLDATLKQSRK